HIENADYTLWVDMTWDPYNRMTTYQETNNGITTWYRYNASGSRYYKKTGAAAPEYTIRDGLAAVAVLGTGTSFTIRKPDGEVIGFKPVNTIKSWYLKDHLGSTRTRVGENGAVQEVLDYYPFGLEMPGRGMVTGAATPWRFTGYERDPESFLDYAQARYYHPGIGRFWSVDPMASKFPSWSPYNYAMNNPLIFIDPDGREVRCYSEAQCDRLVSDIQELYGDAPVAYEQRTQTRRTWFGLGPEKTTTYYTVTVDGESDFNWAQDDYASALFDAIVSEDVVFNVFYQETAQVGNIRNADLQGAGGGIYRIVSSREANIYVDPRGYQRVGDPSSIILMHEMIGHNHPVGTPPPGRLNNAHDINRFYHQKLGIQPKAGYRNPHRGYKGEIQWPRTGYYRR
ncbi:MAG: RHS repeat-associated core domain-containing protein, partial [Cyclonatronaceae bacterium]